MALGREHCLPFSLELWIFEAKGSGAHGGLERTLTHDALSDGVPKNILSFLGIVLQLLCVLSDISELTQCVVCFILLATLFLDPRPEDHSELTPLEMLSVVCGVRVRTAISLCWARTQGVWISIPQLWGENFQGPYAKKKGIESLASLWGLNAMWGPLHDAVALTEFQNGKGEPFFSLRHQRAGQPSGWAGFPECCTTRCLFCAIRWGEQTLLLTASRRNFSPCHTDITSLSLHLNEISRLCLRTPCPVPQLFLMKEKVLGHL